MGKHIININTKDRASFDEHVKHVKELGYNIEEEPLINGDEYTGVASCEYQDYPNEDGQEKAAMFIASNDATNASYIVKFEMVLFVPATNGIGMNKTVSEVMHHFQNGNMLLNVGKMARERPDKFKVITEKEQMESAKQREQQEKTDTDRPS